MPRKRLIASTFRNHSSYHLAIDSIRANPEIEALIGEIESFGFMPSGNISTSSGRGDANLSIRAKGAYGEVRVFVELQMREGDDWERAEEINGSFLTKELKLCQVIWKITNI